MISIIGASCILPKKINNLDSFWNVLVSAQNQASPVPANRWSHERFYHPDSSVPGKTIMKIGHFIDRNIDLFDYESFRISKREAEGLDPQQKLLLEVVWRAFEDAGYAIDNLPTQRVGVYCGGFTLDHFLSQFSAGNRKQIGIHTAAGSTLTMISNRISHTFDFQGPSLTVDTACSSSLVALNNAIDDLNKGSCDFAVVGGVNLMTRPEYPIGMSKGGFMAENGRSKSFMAEGDGYGRGEGAVVIVLRRQTDAKSAGDQIYANCIASSVNQDGRTPGITLPDGEAQKYLMKDVLSRANISTNQVKYVEAHGTGTAAGDPIEAASISAVYGERKDGNICYIGSAKSNFGHLEAGSGLVGVLKAALIIKHKKIPAIAEFTTPNPDLKLNPERISLATKAVDIEGDDNFSVAVNSFGYGGTNAHIILQKPSEDSEVKEESNEDLVANPDTDRVFLITASTKNALIKRLTSIHEALNEKTNLDELAQSLASKVNLGRLRLVFQVKTYKALSQALSISIQNGAEHAQTCDTSRQTLGFVFTGMGPQWWGMGRELYESDPVYKQALDFADSRYQEIGGVSILEELLKPEETSQIMKTEFAQPANFIVQYGLLKTLAARGIKPNMVVGHSVGEVASAFASGILSLDDAIKVSLVRSRLQATLSGQGSMLAASLTMDEATDLMKEYDTSKISIAAVNALDSLTLSGEEKIIDEIAEKLATREIFHKKLTVEVPYHSPFMQKIEAKLLAELADISSQEAKLKTYSTVTGDIYTGAFDGEYWYNNVRQPVLFASAIDNMVEAGCDYFLEIGPHPVLARSIKDIIVAKEASECRQGFTLRRGQQESDMLLNAVIDIYGQTNAFVRLRSAGKLSTALRYHFDPVEATNESALSRADRMDSMLSPMLERRVGPGQIYRTDLGIYNLDYLKAHVVDGDAVLPGASLIEAAFEAARESSKTQTLALEDIRFHSTQALRNDGAELIVQLIPENDGSHIGKVLIQGDNADIDSDPTLLAEAWVSMGEETGDAWLKPQTTTEVSSDTLYQRFQDVGLHSHSTFQPIEALSISADGKEFFGEVKLDESLSPEGFVIHPTLLDGVFQLTAAFIQDPSCAYIPVSINRLVMAVGKLPKRLQAIGRLVSEGKGYVCADIQILDDKGSLIGEIQSLKVRRIKNMSYDQLAPTANYSNVAIAAEMPDIEINCSNTVVFSSEALGSSYKTQNLCGEAVTCANAIVDGNDAEFTLAGIPLTLDSRDALSEYLAKFNDYSAFVLVLPNNLSAVGAGAEAITALKTALDLVRSNGSKPPYFLTLVTRGSLLIESTDNKVLNPVHAAAAGARRVLFSESERPNVGLLDLDEISFSQAATWLPSLSGVVPHDEIAYRNNERFEMLIKNIEYDWNEEFTELQAQNNYRFVAARRVLMRQIVSQPSFASSSIEVAYTLFGAHHGLQESELTPLSLVAGWVDGDRKKAAVGIIPARTNKYWDFDLNNKLCVEVKPSSDIAQVPDVGLYAVAQVIIDHNGINQYSHILLGNDPVSSRVAQLAKEQGATVCKHQDYKLDRNTFFDLILVSNLSQDSRKIRSLLSPMGRVLLTDHKPFKPNAHHEFVLVLDYVASLGNSFKEAVAKILSRPTLIKPIDSSEKVTCLSEFSSVSEDDFYQTAVIDWRQNTSHKLNAIVVNDLFDNPDEYVLVTGGFGGIGRKFLIYLAESGVKRFLITGRSKGALEANADIVRAVQDKGAELEYLSVDLSQNNSVTALRQFQEKKGKIGSILHLAGVIEDAPAYEQTSESFARVFAAKATTLENIIEAVDSKYLKTIIGFSSIALVTGNSRQVSYCGANAYIEAKLSSIASKNLRVLTVHVGAIRDAGMIERDLKLRRHIENTGLNLISTVNLFAGMLKALSTNTQVTTVSAESDWEKWRAFEPAAARSPRFTEMLSNIEGEHLDLASALFDEIFKLDESEQVNTLAEVMREVVAPIMLLETEDLDLSRQFSDLGVDSLMAAEIQASIKMEAGIELSILSLIGKHVSLLNLAENELQKARLN